MTSEDALAYEQIRRTIAQYGLDVDAGRFEALTELFTPTGVLVIDRFDEDTFELAGRSEIASYLARSAAARTADPMRGAYRRHHVSTTLLSLKSGTSARGECYFLAVMSHGIDHWGRYEDTYRVHHDVWRFHRRHVHVEGRIRRGGG